MPRHCESITLGPGHSAIVCSDGPRPKHCRWCGRPAQFECDFPNPRRKSGTCDTAFCPEHGRSVGPNRDYCLAHPAGAEGQLPLGLLTEVR